MGFETKEGLKVFLQNILDKKSIEMQLKFLSHGV
jgi:hypothetical protein